MTFHLKYNFASKTKSYNKKENLYEDVKYRQNCRYFFVHILFLTFPSLFAKFIENYAV